MLRPFMYLRICEKYTSRPNSNHSSHCVCVCDPLAGPHLPVDGPIQFVEWSPLLLSLSPSPSLSLSLSPSLPSRYVLVSAISPQDAYLDSCHCTCMLCAWEKRHQISSRSHSSSLLRSEFVRGFGAVISITVEL